MCISLPGLRHEIRELELRLSEKKNDSDHENEKEYPNWFWGKYKTRADAEQKIKEQSLYLERRERHEMWVRLQRPQVVIEILFF